MTKIQVQQKNLAPNLADLLDPNLQTLDDLENEVTNEDREEKARQILWLYAVQNLANQHFRSVKEKNQ